MSANDKKDEARTLREANGAVEKVSSHGGPDRTLNGSSVKPESYQNQKNSQGSRPASIEREKIKYMFKHMFNI